MSAINEKLHNPDADNVTILVDNVVDKIREDVIREIFEYSPETDMIGFKNLLSNKVYVTSDINPCKLFANDNEFFYNINFNTRVFSCAAKYEDNGGGYVEYKDDGVNPVIHKSLISININIPKNMYKDSFAQNSPNTDFLNNIKICIRHELNHLYKEIFVHSLFFSNGDKHDLIKDYNNDKSFLDAYSDITNKIQYIVQMISSTKDSKLKDIYKEKYRLELKLLYAIYKIVYIEREANVSSFYQHVLTDIRNNSVKDINEYEEYSEYVDLLDLFKNFNDVELFSKYKNDIIDIFGSGASSISAFSKKMIAKCNNVLKKMRGVYNSLCNDKDLSIKESDMTVDNLIESYLEKKRAWMDDTFSFLNEYGIGVKEPIAKYYFNTKQDELIRNVLYVFTGVVKYL